MDDRRDAAPRKRSPTLFDVLRKPDSVGKREGCCPAQSLMRT